jgi:hypothetical protein
MLGEKRREIGNIKQSYDVTTASQFPSVGTTSQPLSGLCIASSCIDCGNNIDSTAKDILRISTTNTEKVTFHNSYHSLPTQSINKVKVSPAILS